MLTSLDDTIGYTTKYSCMWDMEITPWEIQGVLNDGHRPPWGIQQLHSAIGTIYKIYFSEMCSTKNLASNSCWNSKAQQLLVIDERDSICLIWQMFAVCEWQTQGCKRMIFQCPHHIWEQTSLIVAGTVRVSLPFMSVPITQINVIEKNSSTTVPKFLAKKEKSTLI